MAVIIPFPSPPNDHTIRDAIGDCLREAIPMPPTVNSELRILIAMAENLLVNISDDGLCERFITRLDAYDRPA